MRTLIFSLLFLSSSLLRACPSGDGIDYSNASCAQLSETFDQLIVGVGTSCDTIEDCTLVGGAHRWCESYPTLGDASGGRPVNASAYATSPNAARFEALEAEFAERCEGRTDLCSGSLGLCVADGGPNLLTCTNHVCVATLQYCNANNGDGGP